MWFVLSLIAAFFTSLQDLCARRAMGKVDYHLVAWAWAACSLPFLGAAVLQEGGAGIVWAPFLLSLTISGVILSVCFLLYFHAIKISDLSLVVPMLAFTPAYLMITSPLMLGEVPGFWGAMGILFIVLGSYVLNFRQRHIGFWEPFRYLLKNKGSRMMLCVSLFFSISGNIDKIGVRSSSPAVWIFSLNLVIAVILGIVILIRVPRPVRDFSRAWRPLLLMGIFTAVGLVAQMHAIRMTIVPYVIAVKRTSVVMTSLLGLLWFKEDGIRERLTGVILMIFGLFIISFLAG